MSESPDAIAREYIERWEDAWNNEGVAATTGLYTPDSMLVGYALAIGHQEIEKLLETIYDQGWTKISIKVTNAQEVCGLVLAANEYTAVGSGPNVGKTITAKSSHVLTCIDGAWLSAMHTAT